MALETELSAVYQAQLDAMRAADSTPIASGEEPAAPVPAPPASDAPADASQAEPDKKDFVPLKTFLEERRKLETSLAEERKARQIIEERTNLLLRGMTQQPAGAASAPAGAQAPAIPDLDKDPVGHIVGTLQNLGMSQQQIADALTARQQQEQQQQNIAGLQQRAQASEMEFATTTPDYNNATAHLRAARDRELQLMGVADPAQRSQIIARDALVIADQAFQQGKSPAAVLYELAQFRGYKPAAAAAPAVAAADPAQPDAAAKLQNIAAGQAQSQSLGNARGSASPPLTAQRLLEMPEADFLKMVETNEGRALLGS